MNCAAPSFYNPLTRACVCPEGSITIDRDDVRNMYFIL